MRRCPNCGEANLSWAVAVQRTSDAPADGMLRLHDVHPVFGQGCDDCSETVTVMDADEFMGLIATATVPVFDVPRVGPVVPDRRGMLHVEGHAYYPRDPAHHAENRDRYLRQAAVQQALLTHLEAQQ